MSKILKNTTGSIITISDTGVSIPASPGQYTIPPTDYLLWAASNDVIGPIGSGDLVVNDGSTDLGISDGMDLIKGIFPATIKITDGVETVNVTSSNKLEVDAFVSGGTISKPGDNYEIITDGTQISLANSSNPATTIYTYTGAGRLFYSVIQFSDKKVLISVWVNGVEKFEYDLEIVDKLKDLFKDTSALPYLYYHDGEKAVAMTFPSGLEFSTSIQIKARANNANNGRDVDNQIIGIEKDS